MRLPVFLGVLAASSAVGLAAASIVVGSTSDQHPSDRADDAVAASVRLIARTSDPHGGPDWAVRAYTGATGLRCLSLGRLDDQQRFGRIGEDGQIRELGADDSGSCADPAQAPSQLMVSRAAETPQTPASSTLFGTVDPAQVSALQVTDPRRANRKVAIDSGALVLSLAGAEALSRPWTVQLTLTDGRTQSLTF